MKLLSWIVFSVMALAQWAAPLSQISKHERVLAEGELVKFKCGAPDPLDPLRGRYLVVTLDNTNANLLDPNIFRGGETVYATLKMDAEGFASFDMALPAPPSTGLYLRCNLPSHVYDQKIVQLEVPFNRYYLNEDAAPKADAWLNGARSERLKPIWVEVRLRQGLAVITDLKHDGKSVKDFQ